MRILALGDPRSRRGGAVRAQDQHRAVLLDRAEHEHLGADRADLARREVHDGDDERALELLARVVGDPRRRALLAELGPEVDAQLPGRRAGLGEILDGDDPADAHVDLQEVVELDQPPLYWSWPADWSLGGGGCSCCCCWSSGGGGDWSAGW